MDLVIFGAQGLALSAYEAIHNLCSSRKIRCFLVTERGNNAEFLSNVCVCELDAFSKSLSEFERENIEVLIATPENDMQEIEKSLDEHGLFCHVRLTSLRWAQLMGYHHACVREHMPLRAFPVGYHKVNIHIYMAKFYKDKPLIGKYDIPEWVMPIQVGALLCGERIADILDSDGENISGKNGNYSELTALYWIWKNRLLTCSNNKKEDYYGLAHYRRVLELTDDDILRLADNDVDVVLPYPMLYEPDIGAHHARYLNKGDWEAVLAAVAQLQPQYADVFREVLGQKLLYNYNIVLARKKVLKEYCDWLFPILERVEELSVPQGADRADRYIGYIGESLETLYFMYNKDRLNIAYAGCRFLV